MKSKREEEMNEKGKVGGGGREEVSGSCRRSNYQVSLLKENFFASRLFFTPPPIFLSYYIVYPSLFVWTSVHIRRGIFARVRGVEA
jgi:hypothetical protein